MTAAAPGGAWCSACRSRAWLRRHADTIGEPVDVDVDVDTTAPLVASG
ncbi:hypothetical protein [Burkholderia ubonensis]